MSAEQSGQKGAVRVEFDLTAFRNLSDEEIAERFSKAIIPDVIKAMRESGMGVDVEGQCCMVCNPWSRAIG